MGSRDAAHPPLYYRSHVFVCARTAAPTAASPRLLRGQGLGEAPRLHEGARQGARPARDTHQHLPLPRPLRARPLRRHLSRRRLVPRLLHRRRGRRARAPMPATAPASPSSCSPQPEAPRFARGPGLSAPALSSDVALRYDFPQLAIAGFFVFRAAQRRWSWNTARMQISVAEAQAEAPPSFTHQQIRRC